jgi:hypothetical protein
MTDLICSNCALTSAAGPTVQRRKDGQVRCSACANLAKEVEPPKPDDWGRHEVLDRAYLLQYTFEHFICEHPVVKASRSLNYEAQRVNQHLAEFYQLVGKDD